MKKIITMVACALMFLNAFADDPRDGKHIFNYGVTLKRCDSDGNPTSGTDYIEPNTTFIVRSITTTSYVIEIIRYVGKDADLLNERFVEKKTTLEFNGKKTEVPEKVYFILDKSKYDSNAVRLNKRGSFTVGASTTLIKVRPGKKKPTADGTRIYSEFGNDFNIGASAGFKFQPRRKAEFYNSFVVGLSFSSIKVTPYTTEKFIDAESTQSCITVSAGYILEYNKFQFSLFGGLDLMSGEVGKHWIYRNRPWIGLGFGYQIFRSEGEANHK